MVAAGARTVAGTVAEMVAGNRMERTSSLMVVEGRAGGGGGACNIQCHGWMEEEDRAGSVCWTWVHSRSGGSWGGADGPGGNAGGCGPSGASRIGEGLSLGSGAGGSCGGAGGRGGGTSGNHGACFSSIKGLCWGIGGLVLLVLSFSFKMASSSRCTVAFMRCPKAPCGKVGSTA